jgi:hypothetical protein
MSRIEDISEGHYTLGGTMTTQLAEVLVVDPGAIELPQMKLFGVIVGNIDDLESWSGYKFTATGDPSKMTMCTALWRGYVSTYRLKVDGTLVLERLEYPYTDGATPDEVQEPLRGDFWLDLREWFMGNGVKVPFVNGKVQVNQSLWRRKAGLPARPPRK